MAQQMTGAALAAACDDVNRSTTALEPGGKLGFSEKGQFVYVKAMGATTVSGSPVSMSGINSDGYPQVVVGDSDVAGFGGVAEALFASGEFGYVQVKGVASVVLQSGVALGQRVELSDTAGKLKAITTSGDAVGVALQASDNAGNVRKSVYLY